MKETILCKYGEIILKGTNKSHFENMLKRNLQKRIAKYGNFKVFYIQGTVYIEPLDDECDILGAYETAKNTFGISAISHSIEAKKDMDDILNVTKTSFMPYLEGIKTFKVETKRTDKKFPLTSPEISREVGGAILEASNGKYDVDLHNPDMIVRVEVRDFSAYINAGQEKAIGGLPIGTSGKGMLLLSGGIDSPVAGFMMAKRGVTIEAVHFESFPYTSERAKQKVLDLARLMSVYTGPIKVHVISLTKIQEEIRDNCDEDYFTLLLRRFMMRLAEKVAAKNGAEALITGESMGQVASQTMKALTVTDSVVERPVFRPLIGMDKDEIVKISRMINTFETSILPFEDCCTVFTPTHPKTQPVLANVINEEVKLDVEALEKEALESLETIVIE